MQLFPIKNKICLNKTKDEAACLELVEVSMAVALAFLKKWRISEFVFNSEIL